MKFSDGTVLDMSHGPSAFTWIGAANNYNLVGSNMRSNVFEITQRNGAITFGNAGNGGDGNNTIRYDMGDGLADVQLNGGKGVIAFGSNISAQDAILASNSNGDLIVKFRNDTTDAITIHNELVFRQCQFLRDQCHPVRGWDGLGLYVHSVERLGQGERRGNDSITLPGQRRDSGCGRGG